VMTQTQIAEAQNRAMTNE